MELTDFLEMDMLGEHDAEKLMESAMQLQQIMLLYEAGIREIKTKLDILSDESNISGKPSPIDSIKSRIKSPRSIIKKLKRRGFRYLGPVTVYSHLQACGVINDHAETCFCRGALLQRYPAVRRRRDAEG